MKADELFWQIFHDGDYDKIPAALNVLTAAYLQTPDDAVTAAHVAWLHTWCISEVAPARFAPRDDHGQRDSRSLIFPRSGDA